MADSVAMDNIGHKRRVLGTYKITLFYIAIVVTVTLVLLLSGAHA